jgi:hypothetical protein
VLVLVKDCLQMKSIGTGIVERIYACGHNTFLTKSSNKSCHFKLKNFLQEKAVEATKQVKERKEEKT